MNTLIYNPTKSIIGTELCEALKKFGHLPTQMTELPKQNLGVQSRSIVFVIIEDMELSSKLLSYAKLYQHDGVIVACLTKIPDKEVFFTVDPIDVLILPQDLNVLSIKLKKILDVRNARKELQSAERELDFFHQRLQNEHIFADHVYKNQVNFDAMHDPAIRYWVNASPDMNADLIAGARTPKGALNMFLADPKGMGLQAVVCTLQLTAPFYAMTQKGLPLSEIAYELNKKAKTFLPSGYGISATLVSVDADKRIIEVWNGGNPSPVFLDELGRILRRFNSQHAPLGVIEPTTFNSATDIYEYSMRGQLFAYSDGVYELNHENGSPFNETEFLNSLEGDDTYFRFSNAVSYITQSLKNRKPVDDIAMFLVECPLSNDESINDFLPSSQRDIVKTQWKTSHTFHSEEIKYLDIAAVVLGILKNVDYLKSHYDTLKFILNELVVNAVDHGLLLLTSEDKTASEKMYKAVREKKLAALNHGTIEIGLELQIQGEQKRIILHVKDSGPGFNYRQMFGHAGTAPVEYPGDGIKEMRKKVELLEYMGNGNDVLVYYALDGHTIQETKAVVVRHRNKKN